MNKLWFLVLFCISGVGIFNPANVFAQKETFDVITFDPPKGWKKQSAEGVVQFTREDADKGIYCMITLYKSVPGTANPKENFDLAWTSVVKEMVTVSAAPEMQPTATENGWETHSGFAPFENDGNKGIVILVTSSGLKKMVNLIILTNTDVYEKEMTDFLESISLKKLELPTQQVPPTDTENNPIIGTWGIGVSDQQSYAVNNGINGYTSKQYTFTANGTYHFIIKTFQYTSDKLLLTKENGTYQISGNNLTINPKKSVIEAWSKKDGTDKWGKLLSSQNRTLEKVTYQFTKHYFSGIQQWNLVLQAGKATQRDGPFSGNTTFTNAWYYAPVSANNPLIELPGGQQLAAEEKKEPVPQTAPNNNASILGTWCISASDQSTFRVKNGVQSTIFRQYTFTTTGAYSFITKTFDPLMSSMLLGKETGTYQISGDIITITPQKSVLEEWSKKDGRDEWGKLLKKQTIPLEKVIYGFSKYYISDNNEWQLILKAPKQTHRDGAFNSSESNAWIYILSSAARPVIKLPGQ